MAKSPLVNRIEAVFGIVGVIALVVSYFLVTGTNPLPRVLELLGRAGSLSSPETQWTHRVGDQPKRAVAVGGAVIATIPGAVEAMGIGAGESLWRKPADWSAVAGDGAEAVVLLGRGRRGFEAIDPRTGRARWKDDTTVAAWAYRTAVVTLSCQNAGAGTCELASRVPADGTRRWKLAVAGLGGAVDASTDGINGRGGGAMAVRNPTGDFSAAAAAAPGATPSVLGVEVEHRIEMFDLLAGKRLASIAVPSDGQAAVVGSRVIITTARSDRGGCAYTIEAVNPVGGAVAWRKGGYDPHTVSGMACQQRRAPTGGGGVLAVTRTSDGREALLAAADGREVWVGAAGESVRVVADSITLVRAAGGRTVRAIDTATGTARWTADLPRRAALCTCPAAAIVLDQEIGRVSAYAPSTGKQLLSARLSADVFGCGGEGLVLARGRTIGFVGFAAKP